MTDQTIRSMQPPEKGYRIVWDSLPGFGCRISQAGTRAFVVLVASGRPQTIGRYPAWTLGAARAEAKKRLAEKQLGRIHPTRTAFEDAVAAFLADCEHRIRLRTLDDYRRLLRHFTFGRTALADITPRQLVERLNPLSPGERRHAFVAARVFWNWAVRQHLVNTSPMLRMAREPAGKPRSRILAENELRAVWTTARTGISPFCRIVALLILTGQRRGEIAALQWDWIKGDTIEFPASVAKNHRPWTIPIGPEAQTLLSSIDNMVGSAYVFPALRQAKPTTTTFAGWGKPKARFDKECGVTDWTLHDLRRTFSSGMAALGVPQIVVEKLLNHVSGGTQSPIAQVYNRYSYMPEIRDAMLKWESYLASLLSAR